MKQLLFFAVLLVGYTAQAQNTPAPHEDGKQMIHHVYFTLKNPDSVEDKQLLKEGLQSLEAIQEVKHLIIGEPAPTLLVIGTSQRSFISIAWLIKTPIK
jgi:hypothetical protein